MSHPETTQYEDTKHICHACIGDEFLANQIKEQEAQATCSYCGERREALALEDFADRTDDVFREHFKLTPSGPNDYEYMLIKEGLLDWYREGEYVRDVIVDIARVNADIANDTAELLSNWYGDYRTIKHGGIDPYDSEAQYEERDVNDETFHMAWRDFRDEVQSRTRFFSPNAEKILDRIFGDLTALTTHDDKPVIREVGHSDEDRFIWRARIAYSIKELETILERPTREIGPPPPKLTLGGGRMNAPGIPVFYGALDAKTCISEVRPPVGSYVAVAKFEFIRPVRLLDLDVLVDVSVKGSFFDSDFSVRLTRAAFLRYLVREISRPVMPQDEAFEYFPTQAVAEYLANKVDLHLDGIIFRSSQTGGEGRNLVLFNHACRVEQPTQPQKVVGVCVPDSGDDYNNDVAVFVDSSYDSLDNTSDASMEMGGSEPIGLPDDGSTDTGYAGDEHEETDRYAKPTLRIDLDGLAIHDIKSVKYDSHTRTVNWYLETATTKPHLDPEELARLTEPGPPTP